MRLLSSIRNPKSRVSRLVDSIRARVPQSQATIAADAAAFWKASEAAPGIRDLSHWFGEGRWSEEEWTRVGRTHFRMYEDLCLITGKERPLESMLEWGPGGGANACVFKKEFRTIYGVDISPANLQECGRQLKAREFNGWHSIAIDVSSPEDVLRSVPKIDFFLSTAVFQHFPGTEYGIRVARIAHGLLKSNGIALIQTRYEDGSDTMRRKHRDYQKNAVTFTSYGVEEFWRRLVEVGLEPLGVNLVPKTAYAYYWLRKG